MNKRLVLVGCVVLAVLAGAIIFAMTGHKGPQGAATGSSGGCGGEPDDGLVTEQSKGLALVRTSQVAIVEGNQAMHEAGAKLHAQSYDLDKVEKNLGVTDKELVEVHLSSFEVELTEDAKAGADDQDDLQFVDKMILYVRSANPDSTIDQRAVAWFYREESPASTADTLVFEPAADFDFSEFAEEGFELYAKTEGGVPLDDVSFNGTAVFLAVPSE
jgi:hypothetical protein